jgi:hypothetical protein
VQCEVVVNAATYPVASPKGTGGLFSGLNWPGCEADNLILKYFKKMNSSAGTTK